MLKKEIIKLSISSSVTNFNITWLSAKTANKKVKYNIQLFCTFKIKKLLNYEYYKLFFLRNWGINLIFLDNPTVSTDYIKNLTNIANTQKGVFYLLATPAKLI